MENIFKKVTEISNSFEDMDTFMFRGQGNENWQLETTLFRSIKGGENEPKISRRSTLSLEQTLTREFINYASDIMPLKQSISKLPCFTGGIDYRSWWITMQHYCAPTRLLDWSFTPWIALYFACIDQPQSNGKIFYINSLKISEQRHLLFKGEEKKVMRKFEEIEERLHENMFKENSDTHISVLSSNLKDERISAQQSCFTFCTNPTVSHDDFLLKHGDLNFILIPKELKSKILNQLANMNITAKTLFPSLDGMGKFSTEFANRWVNAKFEPN